MVIFVWFFTSESPSTLQHGEQMTYTCERRETITNSYTAIQIKTVYIIHGMEMKANTRLGCINRCEAPPISLTKIEDKDSKTPKNPLISRNKQLDQSPVVWILFPSLILSQCDTCDRFQENDMLNKMKNRT
jgi:hypothetical protein